MSKHISRNRGATINASQKNAHDNVFFNFGTKRPFTPPKKMMAPSEKVIALNLHIGTNVLVHERWLVLKVWYTAGRPNTFAIT